MTFNPDELSDKQEFPAAADDAELPPLTESNDSRAVELMIRKLMQVDAEVSLMLRVMDNGISVVDPYSDQLLEDVRHWLDYCVSALQKSWRGRLRFESRIDNFTSAGRPNVGK